jgi:predicted CDP-diglyceride synthetase/phosphatidate cytidylyltransferase
MNFDSILAENFIKNRLKLPVYNYRQNPSKKQWRYWKQFFLLAILGKIENWDLLIICFNGVFVLTHLNALKIYMSVALDSTKEYLSLFIRKI